MSSSRFPGKVLAPFRGRPLVAHVLERVRGALPDAPLFVLTSTDPSDDPLAAYLERAEVTVFRGPLADVHGRFCQCARQHPAEWILRVCADSPLLGPRAIAAVTAKLRDPEVVASADLVTTIA